MFDVGVNYSGATGSGVGVTPTLAREYVWGPGDGPAGVDELLAEFGPSTGLSESAARETPWWVLQDGGGDIIAVVKDNGWSAGGNGATASTVAAQFVYDAYGSVLAAESLATHPALHLGHKGLFFDRLDVGVVDSLGAENPRLDQGAHATYYMRNRWYSPETGRFLQRDPNATSMVLIESAASHGRGIGAAVAALSPDGMYGDGQNLYQYLRSNPALGSDPLGLFLPTGSTLDTVATGIQVGLAAYNLINQYAQNQLLDVEWAGDWSQADDWYSRSPTFNEKFSDDDDWEGASDYDWTFGVGDDDSGSFGGGDLPMASGMAAGFPLRLPFVKNPLRGVGGAVAATTAAARAARVHGKLQHMLGIRKATAELMRVTRLRSGAFRHNQAFVGPNGAKLSNLRPDVQAIDTAGKIIHVIEITSKSANAANKVTSYFAALQRSGLAAQGWKVVFKQIRVP